MAKFDFLLHPQKRKDYFDWTLFLITIILLGMGLMSLYSATMEEGKSYDFIKQVISSGIGVFSMFFFMYFSDKYISFLSKALYIISIILLIVVLLWGETIHNTKGWLKLGSYTIQPSEIAKFTTILIIAQHLSSKGTNIKNIRDFAIVVGYIALPTILIFLEPDFGTAFVFIAAFIGILFWSGFDLYFLLLIVSIPIVFMASMINIVLTIIVTLGLTVLVIMLKKKIYFTIIFIILIVAIGFLSPKLVDVMFQHQKDRISAFLNPSEDIQKKGWNVVQSKLAIGSGGILGKGFMSGTQTQLKYVPSQKNDFIFSVPAEEFGFLGSIVVLGFFSAFLVRIINIALEINLVFYKIASVGFATIFFYHIVVNIGMAVGLMPVMGIPLPFFSVGGTALIANFSMVGIILGGYRHYRRKKEYKG